MDSTKAMSDRDIPCTDGSADCSILDDFYYDGRNTQTNYSAGDSPIDVLPVVGFTLAVKRTHLFDVRSLQNHPPGPPQALNKLFCVYLI